jgi:NAD(P)-dependent dehydrogenase (short-subunit alcohol dehydrogenase family)
VATPEGGKAIVQTAVDAFGRVDVVVNNAGILRDKAFSNMEPELLDPVIDVHLKGAFNVTRPAWAIMKEQGFGRIVSTSSAAGIFGNFGQTNYGAAKMGLVGFTRVLAVEGAKYNIKANAIAPLALTRMTENLMAGLGDKLDPGLVSPLVAFLAHEDCPVSGQVFSVGGGRVAQVFIGETKGYHHANLSMEDVRDNWATITDRDGYAVPNNLGEETGLFLPFFA